MLDRKRVFDWCWVATTTPTLTVLMPGATSAVPPDLTLGSGAPSVGDRLAWTKIGSQLLVLLTN